MADLLYDMESLETYLRGYDHDAYKTVLKNGLPVRRLYDHLSRLTQELEAAEAKVAELETEIGRYRRAETSRRQGDELQDAIAQRLATPPQTESK